MWKTPIKALLSRHKHFRCCNYIWMGKNKLTLPPGIRVYTCCLGTTMQDVCVCPSSPEDPGTPQFSSVQSLSHVQLFVTPRTAAHQASLSITNSRSPPKLMSIESVMPSNHLILCCPLLCLPSIFPSNRVFSNESALLIRWPKYWSFSFSISPANEHPGLISFRMDWLDLLAVQGTLKSLLQHHSWKASILWCSAFFTVQLSHPYMTTAKTIALTGQTYPSAALKSKSPLERPDPLHSHRDNTVGNRRAFRGHRRSHRKYKPLPFHEECLPDLPDVAEGMGGCAGHTR